MLASPVVWWLSIALALAAAAAGLFLIARAVMPGRNAWPRRRLAAAAALLLTCVGAAALSVILISGPWWLHAPTWALIDRFPASAARETPGAGNDPVTAELIDRLYEWELPRRTRERIAARCVEVLRGPSTRAGQRAVTVLTGLGDEKFVHTPAILARLRDAPAPLRRDMLTEIPRITDMGPAVLAAMAAIVADEREGRYERCRAAWALRGMGPRGADAAAALAAALGAPEDPSGKDSVSTAASRALARIGPAAGAGTDGAGVLAALDAVAADASRPRQARTAARVAASVIRGEHAGEAAALGALLGHEDAEERVLAAKWLRYIGEEREAGPAAPALAVAVDDPDPRVAELAAQTLTNLVARDNRYLDALEQSAAAQAAGGASAPRLRALIDDLRRTVKGLPWSPP